MGGGAPISGLIGGPDRIETLHSNIVSGWIYEAGDSGSPCAGGASPSHALVDAVWARGELVWCAEIEFGLELPVSLVKSDEGVKEWLEYRRRLRVRLEVKVGVAGLGPIGCEDGLVDSIGFGVVEGSGCLGVEPGLRVEHEAHEEQCRTRDCNRVAAMRHG